MTLESDAKFKENLICGLENNMRKLANIRQSTWKSQNWDFDGIFCPKLKIYELKIYRGGMCHDNEEWYKNWRTNWLVVSKPTWGIWQIVTWALENLKHLHFNGLLLIKVFNVWDKKVQRDILIYIWWNWKLMQNLKENWLVFSKIIWKICRIFFHRLKSNFIFESKMTELNQNKNSKQPDQPDAAWKLYSTLEINE